MPENSATSRRIIAAFAWFISIFSVSHADAKKIDAAILDNIKRVGVVSVAGDTLICRRFGITAFGNKFKSFDVADWNLDDVWLEQLQDAIGATGRFEVVPLSAEDRSTIISSIDGKGDADRNLAQAVKENAGEPKLMELFFSRLRSQISTQENSISKNTEFSLTRRPLRKTQSII